jgi:hypothetical protein
MAIDDSDYPALSLVDKIPSLFAIYYRSHMRGVQVAAGGCQTDLMLASFLGTNAARSRARHASAHA